MRKRSLRPKNRSDVPTSLLIALVLIAFIITCFLNYAQYLGSDSNHHAISFLSMGGSSKGTDYADPITHGGRPPALAYPLWWAAPFYSASGESCILHIDIEEEITNSPDPLCRPGYGTEAVSYVTGLLQYGLVRPEDLWISQAGDDISYRVRRRV